jgi:predicted nuclease of predicted toxin-antitoxin system
MSLHFLADQCVPFSIVEELLRHQHQVTLLRELLPIRSADADILAKAIASDFILISLNGDFSDIVAYPPGTHRGVIAIQLHNHPEVIPLLMVRLCHYLAENPSRENYIGKLLIVEAHRIRVRS